MDRLIYVAMSGAREALLAQRALHHNLANLSTPGFKADIRDFRSMPVFGPGFPSRAYAMAERPGVDLRPGAIQNTGRPLDVAVQGEGWIAVMAPDGAEAYTREGALHLVNGVLVTGGGHPVLGSGGPIAVPPHESLTIAADGTLSIRPLGETAQTVVVVDRIRLVNPPSLVKGEDGLMRLKGGGAAPPDGKVRLAAGALEASNVNAVDALVGMIESSRRFELQIRMMEAAKENDSRLNEILAME